MKLRAIIDDGISQVDTSNTESIKEYLSAAFKQCQLDLMPLYSAYDRLLTRCSIFALDFI